MFEKKNGQIIYYISYYYILAAKRREELLLKIQRQMISFDFPLGSRLKLTKKREEKIAQKFGQYSMAIVQNISSFSFLRTWPQDLLQTQEKREDIAAVWFTEQQMLAGWVASHFSGFSCQSLTFLLF